MSLGKKKKKAFASGTVDVRKTLHKNLDFTAKEQYKLIRANLDFTLPENEGAKCPVIGITSGNRGEGKSTTSVNLSYAFAEKGGKILLIDGDLRLSSIAKKLHFKSPIGLSDYLKGKPVMPEDFKTFLLDNWYILTAGDIPPNPSELLGSNKMGNLLDQLRDYFDYIIIDLPPVNLVSDSIAISKFLSGMILVVREEYTEKKELERCYRQLKLSGVNILGCVLNDIKSGKGPYYKYKYRKYKYYSYGYGSYGGYGTYGAYGDPSGREHNKETEAPESNQ